VARTDTAAARLPLAPPLPLPQPLTPPLPLLLSHGDAPATATPLVAGAGGAQPRGGAAGEGTAGDRRGGRRGWLGDDPPRPSPR